ncbi:ATP-dependent zinc metalloprotease FTSH 4, mitochondrial-like [Actinia tenebrosa]|uniref:ATP-dependent zinc metalloprotease FTSH 4, mitochondrial-like n=1 Tax=Actinia tenebrosa TaxID=6105 RepID=A0A6P8I0M2_ACTTE|nr:ATP-dependent zinc metalloprotease FTSH 4, mitochondrial-like [Actinia tenebrosa]
MFSSSGVSPQVGGLLSGAASLLGNAKHAASARCMTYLQKKSWKSLSKDLTTTTTTSTTQKQETQPESPIIAELERSCNRILDDLGLRGLPKDWQKQIITPLSIPAQSDCRPWLVSHVSANSFFENKHGFSEDGTKLIKPRDTHYNPYFTSLSRLLQPNRSINVNQKRFVQHGMSSRIQILEERANYEEDNPKAQADYLRAMVTEDPQYVIRRYESGRYAIDESVKREYLKALVLAEKIDSDDLEKVSRTGHYGYPKGTSYAAEPTRKAKDSRYDGSEDTPLHVVVQSQKGAFFKEQMWNTIRFLIALFLILSVIEAQLQMKMTTNQKEITPDNVDRKFRFNDVQGVDEAKEELQEVVDFLRNPDKFKRLGGKLPTGVLLIGSPGTGKTLLAKAVAGEAGVPFFFCSGSEFDEMFVGVGAARVRNLFAAAREHAPCIVFVDELDAIGGTRIVNDHQPYSRMTLNQLLVELDGFDKSEGIVVIGATNFPEILDKALIRPGRFDTKISVPMPDIKARFHILKVHLKNVTVADDVDIEVLARGTSGFSGADLANLVNQAAVKAATSGDPYVSTKHLEFAKDKIIMGPERKSAVINAENKKIVAYHEGGHALVAYYTPGSLPLHKATIMPRGQALGMVAQIPETDDLQWTKKQLLAKLDVCMAGRVAEEIIFGKDHVTTGASSDSQQATAIAKAMVTNYCMSDKLGMFQIKDTDHLSPETQAIIENEIKRLLSEAYERAKNILVTKSKEHKLLAEALLKYETLDATEIKLVLQGQPLTRQL